jgi:hypothetical protein
MGTYEWRARITALVSGFRRKNRRFLHYASLPVGMTILLRDQVSLVEARVGITELSARPEESWAFGPPKVMKNGPGSATTPPGSTALPFVISTEAYPDFLFRAVRDVHVCGSP